MLFAAKKHRHGFGSVVQRSHFVEVEPMMKSHGAGVGWFKIDLSRNGNGTVSSNGDDVFVQR